MHNVYTSISLKITCNYAAKTKKQYKQLFNDDVLLHILYYVPIVPLYIIKLGTRIIIICTIPALVTTPIVVVLCKRRVL